MIRSNPADRVERPRKEKFKSEVYKAEELEQLFTAIQGDPAEFGVIMAAFYGLRRSEIKCRSCRTKKESPHFLSGIPYGLANGGGSRFRSILWQGRAVRPTHTPQIKKKTPPDKLGEFFYAGGGGRTHTVSPPTDFESVSSANSNTPAYGRYFASIPAPCQIVKASVPGFYGQIFRFFCQKALTNGFHAAIIISVA